MLDVIHSQQKMLVDQDALFCLSLVDKFRELTQDQRHLAQREILEVLYRAKRHAAISKCVIDSNLRQTFNESDSTLYNDD